MYLAFIFKQSQRNTMDRRIAPALVEEASRPIEMLKVILVGLTAPKVHVSDLEIAPEMAGRIPMRFGIVNRPPLVVLDPILCIIRVEVFRMRRKEPFRLGPQGRYALGCVVEVDREAVGLVVILHVAEDIVVDLAEEVNFGLDAPVIFDILESWVLVEQP